MKCFGLLPQLPEVFFEVGAVAERSGVVTLELFELRLIGIFLCNASSATQRST